MMLSIKLISLDKHHDDICASLFKDIMQDENHVNQLHKLLPPIATKNYNLRRTCKSFINYHSFKS